MGKVVDFKGITRLNLNPQRVVNQIPDDLEGVVVMGYTAEGEYYFASSYASGAEVVYLAEAIKKMILDLADPRGE